MTGSDGRFGCGHCCVRGGISATGDTVAQMRAFLRVWYEVRDAALSQSGTRYAMQLSARRLWHWAFGHRPLKHATVLDSGIRYDSECTCGETSVNYEFVQPTISEDEFWRLAR